MNHRQRFICQALVLWLLGVTIIAISDHSDKKNYENKKVNNAEIVASADEYVQEPIVVKPQSKRVLRFELHQGGNYQLRENYIEETVVKEQVYESLEIPQGRTDNFMYMDYRALTNTASAQYELQQYAWTDSQGFRRYGNYYMVAMGTHYGYVGETFRITTDRNNCYDVILGDCKGTDAVSYDGNHSWYHVAGDYRLNVVEFIVQTECLPSEVTVMGDCGVLENIGGNVVKIERLP